MEEYPDYIYTADGCYGIQVIIDYLRQSLISEEDFHNLCLTKTDYFYKPFHLNIYYEESYVTDGQGPPSSQVAITSPQQLEAYLAKFRSMAYEEFRALLWKFRLILSQSLSVEKLQYQWTDEIIGSLINGPGYSTEMIISSLKHRESLASQKINSLVRLSNGKTRKIDILTALIMLLRCLNAKQLRRLIASFTGSASRQLRKKSLTFGHKFTSKKYPISEVTVYGEILTKREGDEIIEKIYQMQREHFKIGNAEETCLVANDSFKGAKGHTCYDTLEVSLSQSNHSLIHALFQQINAPDNYIHGRNK